MSAPGTRRAEWSAAPIPAAAEALSAAGFGERSAELLARRGIEDGAAARRFLEPKLEDLHEAQGLDGLEAAVERLVRARRVGETVTLVGDYDVDGVSGTALLAAVLGACGVEVRTILPHRMRDGYGFQAVHVERAAAQGSTLIVTIDCGTTSHAGAEAAIEAGIDLVVTDHHLPEGELPSGVIHVNPRRETCAYPFAELSGAGLAFKLASEVATACGRPIAPHRLLRVACLGTIADLVPLVGENRVIAKIGLEELAKSPSPGLRALIARARCKPPLTAADVGFRLAPMLNAPGRLDCADKALELLLSRDPRSAFALAEELDGFNRSRREEERRVTVEARSLLAERSPLPPLLVAWSERWHRGVVGIAAGRLAREFSRPVLLLAVDGRSATGSGRSLAELDLHGLLSPWSGRLERFGGHSRAVGLSVGLEELETLRSEWEEAAAVWAGAVGVRRYSYEITLEPAEITGEFLAELERFEPHGEGNPRPLLRLVGPLRLATPPRLFGQGHLSAEAVGPKGARMRLLGWGWAERRAELEGEFQALGTLERDRYRGGWVLRLVDARSEPA